LRRRRLPRSGSGARGRRAVRPGAVAAPEPRPQSEATQVLVVEDDVPLRTTLVGLLGASGFEALGEPDGERALRTLQRQDVDLVLTDLVMPGGGGEELVKQIRQQFPELPVIVMTAFGSVESAVSLMRAGAVDYVTKPLHLHDLIGAIHGVLEATRPQRERARVARESGRHLTGVIGRSKPMRTLFEQIGRIAASSAPVLITGETGAGKEVIATAIHRASGRAAFVPVNCGAIPPSLLESELFGHVRGAFTGADHDRIGLFEAADRGTLFLDEIAELSLSLQAKLLRVLQSGELRRVGDVERRHVNVRLVAATHRDLAAAVAAGAFREDLFYRINVLRLDLPPLRERPADIPLLAEQFLSAITARERQPAKQFTSAALAHLVAFSWPGNVRQLQNVIERSAAFTDGPLIDVADLPDELRGRAAAVPIQERLGHDLPLADIEREHILAVLSRVGGNRSRAAEMLGIPRRTLYRRLDEYRLLNGHD
jgi:DNA-binding NtrC family response regulator